MTNPATVPAARFPAKFAGRCMCGEKFAAGTVIAYRKSYAHSIVGCPACDYGDFSACSTEFLGEHLRSLHVLANNGMNIRSPGVGRLLALIDTVAAELGRRRSSASASVAA